MSGTRLWMDPSLRWFGVVWQDPDQPLQATVIRSRSITPDDEALGELIRQLDEIAGIRALIWCELVGQAGSITGEGRRAVQCQAQVLGALVGWAQCREHTIVWVPPAKVKEAMTGDPRASKEMMVNHAYTSSHGALFNQYRGHGFVEQRKALADALGVLAASGQAVVPERV